MNRKWIYLFLALILPMLIFIFLKRCGKNEFAIPLYYQHNVDSLNAQCNTTYNSPYTLPDSVVRRFGSHSAGASIFVFRDSLSGDEFNLVRESFKPDEFKILKISSVEMGERRVRRWASCVFFAHTPQDIILVDKQDHIRGYYSLGSREDMDRLILEMKILLRKY